MTMVLFLIAKAFKLNYSTPTNNNQRILSNPHNRQIAQSGMNLGQDRQMQMVGGNGGNQFRQYAGQNIRNQNGYNAVQNVRNPVVQNPGIQNVGNQNGLIVVPGNANPTNANQNGKGNVVAARAEGILMRLRKSMQTQTDIAPIYDSDGSAEIQKIVKDEILPIVNQVDARVQNFEIQFLKEAAKFVRDFKSLAKEADESLAKHKALELEIKLLLRAVVSQDIMYIVQNNSVVDISNLQTELDRTKERFENCIIKKENKYAKLWNDWYKKCEECKYDKISYDKAYYDMQQKIEWLQAQLGDLCNTPQNHIAAEYHLGCYFIA
ncbi:hypothetical protein Tco_0595298 [Tanacetum coccineum]